MEIVNEEGTDLSRPMIICVAAMMAHIEGATRMCNLLNRKVEASVWRVDLLRENKRAFNEARRMARSLLYQLNNAFDGTLDKIYTGNGKTADPGRCDALARMGIDLVQIGLAAISRIDNDSRNKERILKKILAYKGDPAYNVEELIEMFEIK